MFENWNLYKFLAIYEPLPFTHMNLICPKTLYSFIRSELFELFKHCDFYCFLKQLQMQIQHVKSNSSLASDAIFIKPLY